MSMKSSHRHVSAEAKPKDALRSLFDGRKTRKRKQTVYTPAFIIDAILEVWPYIGMDPCSGPKSLVPARQKVARPRDGLAVPWAKFTYCNPPFDQLQRWLQHEQRHAETMWLVPVRPSRKWWREMVFHPIESQRPAVCWLHPFAFIGHKNKFPAPLCMIYSGTNLDAFAKAFAGHGTVTLPSRPRSDRHLTLVEAA